MLTFKKAGVLISAAALTVGILTPVAGAQTVGNERAETLPIVVAQANTKVTKNDLIKRFKEVFPKEFSFLTNKDFYMSTGYTEPNDPTIRYELSFSKDIDNEYVYGSVLFVGDKLEVENFYFDPIMTQDVLFPAKYSRDDAQKIADKLVKKLNKDENYELLNTNFNYYSSTLLTEPIVYHFSYAKKHSDITIADQSISITVLGDGQVASYYKSENVKDSFTYDDPAAVKSESDIKKQLQKALKLHLAYTIDTDYRTGKNSVKLVYQPTNALTTGVHAITGQYQTMDGLSSTVPTYSVQPISATALPAKQPNMTEEQALAAAKNILAVDMDGVKLSIESVEESTTEQGKEVFDIYYMYETEYGGTGGSLSFEKATGEVINYDNVKNHLGIYDEEEELNKVLSQQQAFDKAIAYAKEWVPSSVHEYALPYISQDLYFEYNNSYNFIFPRIVNGLQVIGDNISIDVDAETGELLSVYKYGYDNIEWPDPTDVMPIKEATKLFKDELNLDLQYVNLSNVENEQHYSLVYQPMFKDTFISNIDAKTGKWLSVFGTPYVDMPPIEHPTAEEELNYLIQSGILEVDETFNPDASISKEEALKVLMNSLTYMYYGIHDSDSNEQAFEDIPTDHTLHAYIAKGLAIGTIDKSSETFNPEAPLSNQELAKWAVGTLQLDRAAQYSNIYKLNYRDGSHVDKNLRGHVALAYAMGILEANNRQLKPKEDVTYAQLAQVTIRLAHKMHEFQINYY